MKRIIIILLLLMLVGGGGAGGLMMLGIIHNPFGPTPAESAAMEAAKRAEANIKPYKEPTEAMTLIKMRDMIIPVVSSEGVERRVYLSFRLSIVKSEKGAIEKTISRYENAVIDEFIPYFQKYFASNTVLDLDEIKHKLVTIAHKLYGDAVMDVLLSNAFENK